MRGKHALWPSRHDPHGGGKGFRASGPPAGAKPDLLIHAALGLNAKNLEDAKRRIVVV